MPEAYFAKVDKDTTWSDVLSAVQNQIDNSRKKLGYTSIAELSLDKVDFDELIASISQPHPSYARWSSQSRPDKNGIWNCITIKCTSDTRNVIIYTSGRTFPLYVSTNFISSEKLIN